MSNNNKFNGWASVIKSVRTPLGFFTLLALIIDGILIVLATSAEEVPLIAPILLLGILIICVFSIILVKPHALYHPKDWSTRGKVITVNLIFPIEAYKVDLNLDQCFLEIRDKAGKKRPKKHTNLTMGHGGWAFKLSEEVEASDSIRLELTENSGRKWRVNPFAPHEIEARAIQINTD